MFRFVTYDVCANSVFCVVVVVVVVVVPLVELVVVDEDAPADLVEADADKEIFFLYRHKPNEGVV